MTSKATMIKFCITDCSSVSDVVFDFVTTGPISITLES